MTQPAAPADLVLRGTVRPDAHAAPVTAVAVRDGRVVALGSEACAGLTGARTEVVAVDGVVVPGFVDAHVHPVMAGLNRLRCDLDDVHGLDAYRSRIAAHRDTSTDGWFLGSGWYGDVFPGGFPSAAELDNLLGDRPAVLTSHDAHGVWASTAALRRAGIDDATPDPAGGRIHRDERGPRDRVPHGGSGRPGDRPGARAEPGRAGRRAPRGAAPPARVRHRRLAGRRRGPDARDARPLPGLPRRRPVRAAHRQGDGRAVWSLDEDLEQLEALLRRRAESAAWPRFRASAVKIMQDGVCENLTAAVLDHYRGHPGEHGLSFVEPGLLTEIVAAVAGRGFDLHLHAVGDRAVRECLDALAVAPRHPDARHQIAHLDLVDPTDVRRFAELGVLANVQPLWAREDRMLVETKLGYLTVRQRERHFAFGTLHAAGAELAMGSDWPVSSTDPLWGFHVAVNRTAPAADPHAQDQHARTVPLLAGDAIDVANAFHAATAGAARASRLDDTGNLWPGAAADLVVLDADPLAVAAHELSSIAVRATYVDGVAVHG